MRKLLLIGIASFVLTTSTCIAEDSSYDAGKLHDQADQIELETQKSIDKAGYPAEMSRIVWKSQMNFSRLLMRQQDEIIRQNAVRILGKIKAVDAAESLIRMLKNDRSEAVREEVAIALGEIKSPKSVEPLVQAIKKDDYEQVREAAAVAVGRIK